MSLPWAARGLKIPYVVRKDRQSRDSAVVVAAALNCRRKLATRARWDDLSGCTGPLCTVRMGEARALTRCGADGRGACPGNRAAGCAAVPEPCWESVHRGEPARLRQPVHADLGADPVKDVRLRPAHQNGRDAERGGWYQARRSQEFDGADGLEAPGLKSSTRRLSVPPVAAGFALGTNILELPVRQTGGAISSATPQSARFIIGSLIEDCPLALLGRDSLPACVISGHPSSGRRGSHAFVSQGVGLSRPRGHSCLRARRSTQWTRD
ncbi:hypothetical protein SAMN06272781_7993 [Streptomyces sp. 1222.2]|nr:hypothetical protein SAMN06272781_7993 [Streptomyces sp. 1222.2]